MSYCRKTLYSASRGSSHRSAQELLAGLSRPFPDHGSFFPLQDGGSRGLPYEALQPKSQEDDRPAEHDGRRGLLILPPDAAGEAEETCRFLFLWGEGREGEDGVSG